MLEKERVQNQTKPDKTSPSVTSEYSKPIEGRTMTTKLERESIAELAVSEYFAEFYPFLSEHISSQRLVTAHNHLQKKVAKRIRQLNDGEFVS